ncbi:uncharacterized protein MYCGRDRAFT_110484, partial [Zymoseptoria tritici IPO323]
MWPQLSALCCWSGACTGNLFPYHTDIMQRISAMATVRSLLDEHAPLMPRASCACTKVQHLRWPGGGTPNSILPMPPPIMPPISSDLPCSLLDDPARKFHLRGVRTQLESYFPKHKGVIITENWEEDSPWLRVRRFTTLGPDANPEASGSELEDEEHHQYLGYTVHTIPIEYAIDKGHIVQVRIFSASCTRRPPKASQERLQLFPL